MKGLKYPVNNLQIVQAIAGCVQLRSAINSTPWLDALGQSLQGQTGVYTTYKDPDSGNLIILFDPNFIPLQQMLVILQQWGVAGVANSASPAMQVGGFIHEHHEVKSLLPMIAGMLVTQTLKLRGGWAMLANLIAASITSEALGKLENGCLLAIQPQAEIQDKTIPITPEESSSSVQVIHAIPGRLRLRITPMLEKPEYAEHLQKLLAQNQIVTKLRINAEAASVLIEYESDRSSDTEIYENLISPIEAEISKLLADENKTQIADRSSNLEAEIEEIPPIENSQLEQGDLNQPLNYLKPQLACAIYNSILRRVTANN